jgi:DNA-binding transcriptional LysR family regulator
MVVSCLSRFVCALGRWPRGGVAGRRFAIETSLRGTQQSRRVDAMDLLAQMATFVRVVESGSLTAAGRGQRLSVPAVSRQLRALERDLGAALVVRTTRKLRITDDGQRFYAHCVRLLREVADARASVAKGSAVRGRLRVSVPISLGVTHVVPRLPALAERHPALVVELRLEDHLVDLVAEGVDVVVRTGLRLPDASSLVAHALFQFARVVVATPRLLREHGAPKRPAALARTPCLVQLAAAGPLPWTLHRADERVEIAPPSKLAANAPLALLDAARRGMGFALLPDWLVADDLERGTLRRVLPEWTGAAQSAWAVHPAELRGDPRVRAFVEHVRRDAT